MYSLVDSLKNMTLHKKVLMLALPMVLSNITVPLLGLVDTAVIGHLNYSWYLGGVALGSTMISVSLWLLGFLRMSTTGMTAQALGKNDKQQLALILFQGLLMAFLLAFIFIVIHSYIASLILGWSDASSEVKFYASEYFSIRVWGAPAALANFVLLGWLLGMQNTRLPMWMVIITNVTNILFDILFVTVFDYKVSGAATASVISDFVGMIFGFICVYGYWARDHLASINEVKEKIFNGISQFVRLNRDIFLRSLCLQAVFSFMAFRGAVYGDNIVAANAVLMSFLMTISYGMDGFAYAIEALVGKAIGQKSREGLYQSILSTFLWCFIICVCLTGVFFCFSDNIIALLTDIPRVREVANEYVGWIVAMPLVSMWCYLLDGIFIGGTKGKEMRNGMIISLLLFFGAFFASAQWNNHGLWLAMTVFMLARGLTLGVVFLHQVRTRTFL